MFSDYIGAVILIFFAEMGDKTQFLSMAFATKYPVKKILIGVFIGSFLNHGLAILLGRALLEFVPLEIIGVVAGLMFIFFAFKSLDIEEEEIEEGVIKYGPIVTVALAFFLGELGDKTQLAALGLAVDSTYMFMVLLGTVTGMVLTSSLGIFVGLKLGKKIPEDKLKISAYIIFLLFGVQKLYQSFLHQYSSVWTGLIIGALIVISLYVIKKFRKKYNSLEETSFMRQAEVLKQTKTKIEFKIETMCKGTDHCGVCDGKECLVGYMRYLLSHASHPITQEESKKIATLKNKIFDKAEAEMIVQLLIEYYDHYPKEFSDNEQLQMLRKTAEFIAYQKIIDDKDYKTYKKNVK